MAGYWLNSLIKKWWRLKILIVKAFLRLVYVSVRHRHSFIRSEFGGSTLPIISTTDLYSATSLLIFSADNYSNITAIWDYVLYQYWKYSFSPSLVINSFFDSK
jgi:hypothetical protein